MSNRFGYAVTYETCDLSDKFYLIVYQPRWRNTQTYDVLSVVLETVF